jgi:hypothetical protein
MTEGLPAKNDCSTEVLLDFCTRVTFLRNIRVARPWYGDLSFHREVDYLGLGRGLILFYLWRYVEGSVYLTCASVLIFLWTVIQKG